MQVKGERIMDGFAAWMALGRTTPAWCRNDAELQQDEENDTQLKKAVDAVRGKFAIID